MLVIETEAKRPGDQDIHRIADCAHGQFQDGCPLQLIEPGKLYILRVGRRYRFRRRHTFANSAR